MTRKVNESDVLKTVAKQCLAKQGTCGNQCGTCEWDLWRYANLSEQQYNTVMMAARMEDAEERITNEREMALLELRVKAANRAVAPSRPASGLPIAVIFFIAALAVFILTEKVAGWHGVAPLRFLRTTLSYYATKQKTVEPSYNATTAPVSEKRRLVTDKIIELCDWTMDNLEDDNDDYDIDCKDVAVIFWRKWHRERENGKWPFENVTFDWYQGYNYSHIVPVVWWKDGNRTYKWPVEPAWREMGREGFGAERDPMWETENHVLDLSAYDISNGTRWSY